MNNNEIIKERYANALIAKRQYAVVDTVDCVFLIGTTLPKGSVVTFGLFVLENTDSSLDVCGQPAKELENGLARLWQRSTWAALQNHLLELRSKYQADKLERETALQATLAKLESFFPGCSNEQLRNMLRNMPIEQLKTFGLTK